MSGEPARAADPAAGGAAPRKRRSNVKGMGPGVAEMSFVERKSEPVVIFMADKTSPGAWNLPVYKMFADPFNTVGLVIDPSMHRGFRFRVLDIFENKEWFLSCPEDMYDLLVLVGASGRYLIESVFRKKDNEVACAASSQKLGLIAGRYVGKDDPVLVVRCQSGSPAVGEVLEPFAVPHLVEGWMRGSHHGPLMPVSFADARPIRFDGPPRVIAAGYQLCQGKLIGPVDLFSDVAFDEARKEANRMATYMRRHGAAMIASQAFEVKTKKRWRKLTWEEVRQVLRSGFCEWETLPDSVQTDNEMGLGGNPNDPFASWLSL